MIAGVYRIPKSIIKVAEDLGLDAMATGGGVDFIYKRLGTNTDGSPKLAILTAALTPHSPDSLREKSEIGILLNSDWTASIYIPFSTAREAMEVLARMYDPHEPEPA